jgi:hypothetical protein
VVKLPSYLFNITYLTLLLEEVEVAVLSQPIVFDIEPLPVTLIYTFPLFEAGALSLIVTPPVLELLL